MSQFSDPEVQVSVRTALWNSPYPELRNVSSFVRDGGVLLGGFADSHWMKQIAQSVIRKVPGVQKIENRISVIDFAPMGSSGLDG